MKLIRVPCFELHFNNQIKTRNLSQKEGILTAPWPSLMPILWEFSEESVDIEK